MSPQSPINHAALEQLRKIQRPGGPSLLERILRLYETESAELLANLKEAIEKGEGEGVQRAAHRFKSISANVGAETLAAQCAELEHRGQAARLDDAPARLEDLEQEHRRVSEALTEELSKVAET